MVLIATPPIDVGAALSDPSNLSDEALEIVKETTRSSRGHRTWMEKRKYAEAVVNLGRELEAQNKRVSGLDIWSKITDAKCQELGRDMIELDSREMLPGSGMPGAQELGTAWLVDGLHFGPKVSTSSTYAYRT